MIDPGAFEFSSPAVDSDGDGLFDDEDNCPAIANPAQRPAWHESNPGRRSHGHHLIGAPATGSTHHESEIIDP